MEATTTSQHTKEARLIKIEAIRAEIKARRLQREMEEEESIPLYSDLVKKYPHSRGNASFILRGASLPGRMPNYTMEGWGQKKWFRIEGNSMSSDDKALSIPAGSKVLAKRLTDNPYSIPFKKPLLITCMNEGRRITYCLYASHCHYDACELVCKNYSPVRENEHIEIWYNDIIEIFEIEMVIRQ